jgi:hypothetical protein
MATTGSRREALNAGIRPARIPIIIQMEMARKRIPPDINTGKLNKLVRIMVSK